MRRRPCARRRRRAGRRFLVSQKRAPIRGGVGITLIVAAEAPGPCVCVCVCVCARARARAGERHQALDESEGGKEGERETGTRLLTRRPSL